MKSILYVFSYLVAIVLANLLIAKLGLDYAFVVSLVFVSFDFASRDKLHDAWGGRGLMWKMGTLIFVGSVLSWLINRNAGQVAFASFASFAIASTADTLVYHLLRKRGYMIKANGSNFVGAVLDSFMFPLLLSGGFLPLITLKQIVAKVGGGLVWSWLLMDKSKRQDILCRYNWHTESVEIDLTHKQCTHCKNIWSFNPYADV